MRLSFDFDSTLSRQIIQNYAQELINRGIEVINPQSNDEDDLMQDFVSIITSFTARLYGRRRSKRMTEKIIENAKKE